MEKEHLLVPAHTLKTLEQLECLKMQSGFGSVFTKK